MKAVPRVKPVKRMKTIKAWAVVERETGEIFRDTINGGRNWDYEIFNNRNAFGNSLCDEYRIVRVEIRELPKPRRGK